MTAIYFLCPFFSVDRQMEISDLTEGTGWFTGAEEAELILSDLIKKTTLIRGHDAN